MSEQTPDPVRRSEPPAESTSLRGSGESAPSQPIESGYQPWWIPPFLGRVPPEVDREQVSLIGVIALALLFEHYDISMLGSALKYIRESFDLSQSDLGTFTGLVRLGALPALILVPFADRIGRRRLFLVCVIGTSVATFLTAFTQTAAQFIAVQMLARTFLISGSASAFVIVAEEVPAEHRGWAIGILGALGSVGFGLGAAIFSLVEVLPYGWRALYVFGAFPLLLLPWFRRRVPETRRFRDSEAGSVDPGLSAAGWWRPFATLISQYPGRALGIAVIGFLMTVGTGPAHQLLGDFVLTDHGWTPGAYSLMFVIGGGVGILGNTVAGRLADRMGRRQVALLLLGGFPLIAAAFYNAPGWLLPAFWIPLVFATTGAGTIVRALSTELFPTSSRGTAAGSLSFFETLGAAGGLFLVTLLVAEGEGYAGVLSGVVFATLLAGLCALLLPETARRELEDISEKG